jgi:group I intron endonuclease
MVGIYQIRNKINNKLYIGSSGDISLRWLYHLRDMENGVHHNSKILDDYVKYGATSFEFTILDVFEDDTNVKIREQEYINTVSKDLLYNIHNPVGHMQTKVYDIEGFKDFIDKKWLVPDGISEKETKQYRIYKEEDKDEIIIMFCRFRVLNLFYSQITFNRTVVAMAELLGYKIVSGRSRINGKQHTYKLIYKL